MAQPAPDPQEKFPHLKSLYRDKNISIRALDTAIVVGLVVIVVAVILGLRDPGLTITFDSRGGTDVAAQRQMYGETLTLPEPPTREGYTFTGWYLDAGCSTAWEESRTIESDMTLYAGWQEESSG